jgi:NADPH2:quinone reductase
MKQICVGAFGDVSQLHVREVADPVPARGEVTVAIHACGLNYSDLLQREGLYLGGPQPPFVPGIEATGIVIDRGPDVELAIGTRVMVVGRHGLHAERAAVPAASCLPLPYALTDTAGAAFPVSYLTAYHALITVAHARNGEVAVIHAAAGSLGTAAVQIAKLLGLHVIATASTEAKRARVRELGADEVVDYDGFVDAARVRGGAAIVLESIGGEVMRRSLHALAPLGRLVTVGLAGKDAPPIDVLKLIFKSQAILGLHLEAILARPDLVAAAIAWLLERVSTGAIAIQVGHMLPLAEIRAAHELLASRRSYGKIVLVP